MPLTADADIARLLEETRALALVGASDRPDRAAFEVMGMLLAQGYRVIPVNPQLAGQVIHGQTVVAQLADIAEPTDMVDVFRRSEFVSGVVDEAIAVGARAVWTQLGVIDPVAAARAEAAGLDVVMDRCPKIEIPRLGLKKK
ncbi:CoA-binding protein [Sandarakinorhabdus limnophila]|uniref:CoA-binding protein n=1 Tax=Sandarakinorhabdus limnophila TaxID=210512 RepID=UPI0026F08B10|nr:CoA-binding protein [Sandarakinorhabdus limnophila]